MGAIVIGGIALSVAAVLYYVTMFAFIELVITIRTN
jgi:hypothetical protein